MKFEFGGVVRGKESPRLAKMTRTVSLAINDLMAGLRLVYPDATGEEMLSAGMSGMIDHMVQLASHDDDPEKVLKDFANTLTGLHCVHEALRRKKSRKDGKGECLCGKPH